MNLDNSLIKIDHTTQEKCKIIDETRWSNDFSWKEIKDLAQYMSIYKVRKGMIICREGIIEPYMFLILKGTVDILKEDSDQHKKVITSLGAGSVIGEMSLIDGEPRSASVIANIDSILLVLTKDNFFYLLKEIPHLGMKLLFKIAGSMSQRLRQTDKALVDYLET